jgi:hypothetical protein
MPNVIRNIEAVYGQQTKDNSMAVVLPVDQIINSQDTLTTGGVEGELTLTNANQAYEVKVGASKLPGRKLVTFYALDANMYWGYTNTLTAATGTPIWKDQLASWAMDDQGSIYVLCIAPGKKGRVTESP